MHIHELSDKQIDELTDKVADKLSTFMNNIINENHVCPMCMHHLVIMMCQKFMEEGNTENDVKH